ncbi:MULTISPECIES: hypothetical protein [Halorussus]|uniref:hypothetical protein n=1 Tax=Halorussus TaxID=1070314 RepID=UPI0020A006A8|nr:hypothetical protein [Halorussus vallis]USZ75848.1 hypothetical protein NGM07_00655 [Halorussus vallis]
MVAVSALLTLGLLAMLPFGLYNFWVRHSDRPRVWKLYKTFAVLASASCLVTFGDTVRVRLPYLLELGVLGVGLASLALWMWFGAEANRNRVN